MGLYRKVSCAYWQGELAESLRGDSLAHAVAFYLMTCPSTNAIGCYRLSIATLCDDLGEPLARVSEALRKLSETGFVVVDKRFRMVFVTEFARHEYGEMPNLADNRIKSLRAALPAMVDVCRKSFIWKAFWDRYGEPWAEVLAGLTPPNASPSGALPEPFRSPSGQGAYQDQDQDQDQEIPPHPPEGGDPPVPRQRKLPRKTTAADVSRELVIPAELLRAGIDAKAVAERVRTCKALKHIETWQLELDRLAPLVAEIGAEAVVETWRDAIASEWQGCTPEMARSKARRGNGKPVQVKDRRFAQPHTIAPGSTGKDHGIDF